DLQTATPRYPPISFDFSASSVHFSPTLRHIFVGGFGSIGDFVGAMIDARTGRILLRGPAVGTCLIPPDGGAIVTMQYRPLPGALVKRDDLGVALSSLDVGAPLTAIEISPSGTPLVAVVDTSSAVTIVAAESGARLARKPIPGTIASTVFVDGGQAVAAGGS